MIELEQFRVRGFRLALLMKFNNLYQLPYSEATRVPQNTSPRIIYFDAIQQGHCGWIIPIRVISRIAHRSLERLRIGWEGSTESLK